MKNNQKGFTEEEKIVLLQTLKETGLESGQLQKTLNQELLIKEMSVIFNAFV